MIIHAILQLIERDPFRFVAPEATVREACELLVGYRAGALPVIEGGALVGIISERDVIARLVVKGLSADTTPVSAIMTANPQTVTAADSLAHAYQTMLDGRFRHLPVMDGETVIGVISMRDIPAQYQLMVERWNEIRRAPEPGQ